MMVIRFTCTSRTAFIDPLDDRKWHHVCGTWEYGDGRVTLYIDGLQNISSIGKALGSTIQGNNFIKNLNERLFLIFNCILKGIVKSEALPSRCVNYHQQNCSLTCVNAFSLETFALHFYGCPHENTFAVSYSSESSFCQVVEKLLNLLWIRINLTKHFASYSVSTFFGGSFIQSITQSFLPLAGICWNFTLEYYQRDIL